MRRHCLSLHNLFFIFAVTIELVCAGCGASGLEAQAKAAHVASEAITRGGELIRTERREAQRQAVMRSVSQAEAGLAVLKVREKWEPIVNAYEGLRTAFLLYLDGLALAATEEHPNTTALLKLLGDVVHAWNVAESFEDSLGVDIPSMPSPLRELFQ